MSVTSIVTFKYNYLTYCILSQKNGIVTPQKIISKKFGAKAVSVITLQQQKNIRIMKRLTFMIIAFMSIAIQGSAQGIIIEKKNSSHI